MAPYSSILAWKIPWTEKPGRLQSLGSLSQTRLSDFTFTFHFHALEKGMATHSSVLAWRVPGTGEPGGLPSMGSCRGGHDWSDLAAAARGSWDVCLCRVPIFLDAFCDARLSVKQTRTLQLDEEVLCVSYSPDQKLLAVSLLDCTVKVFYVDTLKVWWLCLWVFSFWLNLGWDYRRGLDCFQQ